MVCEGVVDVILSPEVDAFVEGQPWAMRVLIRSRLRRLSEPAAFVETRPLPGRPDSRIATIGPFTNTCRLLQEHEAQAAGARYPALIVVTIDRTDELRANAQRLLQEAQEADEPY
jgi:hypothetical protein